MKGRETLFSAIGRRYASLCAHPEGKAGCIVLALMDLFHRPFASWVLSAIPPSSSYLDIGAGSGYLAKRLLKRFRFSSVTLLDSSALSLSFAGRRLGHRVSLVPGKAEALPFPDSSFACAVMQDSIYYADPDRTFSEVFRVLQPGGVFIVAFEAADPLSSPPWLSGIATVRSSSMVQSSLEDAGFAVMESDHGRRAWVRIVAAKPMC